MIGVVGRLHDGESLAGQLPHAGQHTHGVAVIERARGLVHDDGLGVLGQCPGNEHELLLAAGDLRVGAMGQVLDADAGQRLVGTLQLGFPGRGEHLQVVSRGHEHHVDHFVVVHRRVRLGNVGDLAGALAHRKRTQILPVHQNRAAIVRGKPQDAAEQGGFAHAVGPEHVHEAPIGNGERKVVQNLAASVGEAQVRYVDAHSFFFRVMRYRKNGAPTKAVRMPMGISAVVARRATSSTMSRKLAPMSMDAGMRRR